MKRSLVVFVFFLIQFVSRASVPVASLSDSWLVFDNSYKSFVPYIPGQEAPKVLYYSLKPGKFQGDTLQFISHKGLCLYFDYRLIYQNTGQGEILIKIPINKLSSGVSSDSVILAFYKRDGLKVNKLRAEIITSGNWSKQTDASGPFDFLQIKLRKISNWNQILLFSIFAVVLLLIVSKSLFPDNINFLQAVGMSYTAKTTSGSAFLNATLIIKILINSICIATFTYFLLNTERENVNPILGFDTYGEGNIISYWYIMFCAILVHIFKFTYNYLCANFSNMTHLLQSQNVMFVNIYYALNLVLLFLLIGSNVSPSMSKWILDKSPQIIAFYFLIPVFLLVLNIIKLAGLRNVYLFSYICTAEILPLLVALKFLI